MSENEITRAEESDAGCWVDGHWGQYGIARVVEIAADAGYDDEVVSIAHRHLASMGPSDAPIIDDDEWEILLDSDDDVTAWLNAHVAPTGYAFGWFDGEYFLWAIEEWEEA